MKYRIEEVDKNGRFYYDELYDSIEEAIEVIKEYEAENDAEGIERYSITYYVVDENNEVVYLYCSKKG